MGCQKAWSYGRPGVKATAAGHQEKVLPLPGQMRSGVFRPNKQYPEDANLRLAKDSIVPDSSVKSLYDA